LNKDEGFRLFFDHWGSRIYLFSSEITYALNYAGNDSEARRLDIDYNAFRALGRRHILATVRIDENFNPRVRFLDAF